jgi:hypothetical protein
MKTITRSEALQKRLSRFFTGIPCQKRAHVSERWACNGGCVACDTEARHLAKARDTVTMGRIVAIARASVIGREYPR